MSRARAKLAGFAIAALVALLNAAPAAAVTITEFPIGSLKSSETQPGYIASSPTGRLWFVDLVGKGVRQMDTSGQLVGGLVAAPPGAPAPSSDLAFRADGALSWTVNNPTGGNQFFAITRAPNGTVEEDGDYESFINGSAVAYAGNDLYATFQHLDTGVPAGFSLCGFLEDLECFGEDLVDSRLTDLTLDQSGHLWAMQPGGDLIRRTNAARTAFDLAVPAPGNSEPNRAALGPDGNIWVTGFGNAPDSSNTTNQIIRVSPAGVPTSFVLPPGRGPFDIAAGPDGALWFTELLSGSIGRITTCGEYTSYPLPNPSSLPYGITLGADGNLWFTEFLGDKVGRLVPDPATDRCAKPGPPADLTAPTLGALRLSRSAFRAAPSGASTSSAATSRRKPPIGTRVSFTLSEPGTVTFTVEARSKGRKVGKRCVKPKPANAGKKRCTRWTRLKGSFSVTGRSGANSFTFRGRLAGKPLKPGPYRLSGQARDAANNASAPKRKSFTVLR